MKKENKTVGEERNLSLTKKNFIKLTLTRQKLLIFVSLLSCSLLIFQAVVTIRVQAASRTISGRVFQDYDGDGTFDTTQTITNGGGGTIGVAVDRGIQNVTVTAYDVNGAIQPAATTSAAGTYTITTLAASTGPYRIEFTNLPAGYYPGARSTDSVSGGTTTNSGTTTQFVSDANTTNVNLAINHPSDYSENNPLLATSSYQFGHRNDSPNTNALPSFLYSVGSNSTTSATGYSTGVQNVEATKTQIGATFGLAYRRSTDTLYAAAFMKRHMGLGPGGTGAIYQVTSVSNTTAGTPSVFTTIPDTGADTHPTVTGAGVIWEQDFNTFGIIGARGLGGLEISDDGNTLYTVNLATRELFEIPVSSAVPISRGIIPSPTCTNGVGRPFALKFYRGLLYVGGVCTGESGGTAANLRAYVYTFTPSTLSFSASPVLNFALNYPRGCVDDSATDPTCHGGEENAEWRPWITTLNFNTVDADNDTQVAYPQAVLTDIEFVGNDMILGFRDRIGDQGGNGSRNPADASDTTQFVTNTAGDILRANSNGAGGWTIENNSQSNPTGTFGPTAGQNNGDGPGDGEFYHGDVHTYHDEVSNGGLAYIPGFPETVMTAMDPANFGSAVWDGGLRWMSNATTGGGQTKGYIVYDGNRDDLLFGKANGVGELEPLSRRAPIELGSRVWRDTDNDGVQDPVNGTTEAGIQNVTVRLYRPGFGPDGVAGNADDNTALATAVTDVNGEYYFTSGTAADPNTGDNIGIFNGNILPFTYYEIRVDNNTNFAGGGVLNSGGTPLNLTIPSAVTTQSGDDNGSDSDGLYDLNTNCSSTGNRCPTIGVTTGEAGANNHTLDFGFTTGTTYTTANTYSVGNRIWFDTDNDNLRDTAGTPEVGIANVSVSIFADTDNNGTPDTIAAPFQTTSTDTNGYYRFDGLTAGNYVVRVDPKNFAVGDALAGYQNTTGTEADPDSAVDNNDNGVNPASANNPQTSVNGILSGAITVGPGTTEPTGEADLGTGDSSITDNRADMTLDYGFYRLCLGGIVWIDANNNGLYASGTESVLGNVIVRLFDSAGTTEIPVGADGVLGTADDGLNGVATSAGGAYSFCGLGAGDYVVKITPTSGATSSSAVGYEPAPDPDNNTDSDDNGTNGTGGNAGLIVSLPITLSAGTEPTITNSTGTTTNTTVDFGLFLAPSAVDLVGVKAYQKKNRVLLVWESGYEVDNLGYNVIRDIEGNREVITKSMVAGSVLQVGTGTPLTAVNSYSWFDTLTDKDMQAGVSYWLEAVDVNGKRDLHGPFTPEYGMPSDIPERAKTLSEIGRDNGTQMQREYPAIQKQQSSSSSSSSTDKKKAKEALSVANQTQSELAGRDAVKITVRKDGWYRVSREQLTAAGFNSYSRTNTWQLFAGGEEQAIKVNTDSSIEFYGKALNTNSTDGRVYWLIGGGSKQARRVEARGDAGISLDAPSTFMQTVELRDRILRFSALLNGDEDNFFGPGIANNVETEQSFLLTDFNENSNESVTVEVGVQGVTWQEHSIEVRFNGEVIGTIDSEGRQRPSRSFNVPVSRLIRGKNTVSLISLNGSSDFNLVDFARITYPRRAKAVNNQLTFGTKAGQPTRIDGFTTNQLRVVDVTNPSTPFEIYVDPQQGSDNSYYFTLSSGFGGRKVMAFAAGQESATAEVVANSASNLKSVDNAANFLIVTHKSLANAAQVLREYRQRQGMNTIVVDMEDVYDEFSFGVHDANALKAFLRYAVTEWNGKPGYILLFGDASYDPRNYLGGGGEAIDLVPTMIVETDFLETASDESLADIDGDGIAEASMGRLPVRNANEATLVVNKLISYETTKIGTPGERGGVIVSDSSGGEDFRGKSQQVRAMMPLNMQVQFINRSDADVNTVRERIIGAFNSGPAIVNFMGHGSAMIWTNANLFSSASASNLQNGSRLPVAVLMTCLNGSFAERNDGLAESLIKAQNGGAVAVWASTGLANPEEQFLANQYFYHVLFSNEGILLSDAVREAKRATQDKNFRRSWVFLGDPTSRLK